MQGQDSWYRLSNRMVHGAPADSNPVVTREAQYLTDYTTGAKSVDSTLLRYLIQISVLRKRK
jgi:hypothetical protein